MDRPSDPSPEAEGASTAFRETQEAYRAITNTEQFPGSPRPPPWSISTPQGEGGCSTSWTPAPENGQPPTIHRTNSGLRLPPMMSSWQHGTSHLNAGVSPSGMISQSPPSKTGLPRGDELDGNNVAGSHLRSVASECLAYGPSFPFQVNNDGHMEEGYPHQSDIQKSADRCARPDYPWQPTARAPVAYMGHGSREEVMMPDAIPRPPIRTADPAGINGLLWADPSGTARPGSPSFTPRMSLPGSAHAGHASHCRR